MPMWWNKETSVHSGSAGDVDFGNAKNTSRLLGLVWGNHGNGSLGAGLKAIAPIKGEIELLVRAQQT